MTLRTMPHSKIISYDGKGSYSGFLLPVYTINDLFSSTGFTPQQINITTIAPQVIKGPHLHLIRSVIITCFQGNIRVITKEQNLFSEYYSGESYNYRSVEIRKGIPAAIQNIGEHEAYILSLWDKPWTPDLNDEVFIDFSDYDFQIK